MRLWKLSESKRFTGFQGTGCNRFNINHLEATNFHRLPYILNCGSGPGGRRFKPNSDLPSTKWCRRYWDCEVLKDQRMRSRHPSAHPGKQRTPQCGWACIRPRILPMQVWVQTSCPPRTTAVRVGMGFANPPIKCSKGMGWIDSCETARLCLIGFFTARVFCPWRANFGWNILRKFDIINYVKMSKVDFERLGWQITKVGIFCCKIGCLL
jgi:hypothetical protein